MRLHPGQAKSGRQKSQNKETSTFTTATNDKDEKTSNAKSEGIPKTFPQSTTTTPKLKEDEVKNSKLKEDEVKSSKLKNNKVKNSTGDEFGEEHLPPVAETPVTVYYVSKLSSRKSFLVEVHRNHLFRSKLFQSD